MRCLRRLLLVPLLILPVTASPAGLERFVPPHAELVVVVPSLASFASQGKTLLDVAARVPGAGRKVRDARAVVRSWLGFDLLDPASMNQAGLDPRGGTLMFVAERGGRAKAVFVLPVASVSRFEAAAERIAREQLELGTRSVEPGSPRVVVWRSKKKRGGEELAYAIVGRLAVLSPERGGAEVVRAALGQSEAGHIGATPAYRDMTAALGPGLAVAVYVPEGSQLLEKTPSLDGGFAMGLGGGGDRVRLVFAPVLEEGAPLLDEPVDAASLLEKLDPASALLFASGADVHALVPQKAFLAHFAQGRTPEERELWTAVHDAFGSGIAAGIVVRPSREAETDSSNALAPVIQFEAVLGLSDPEATREALRSAMRARDLPEDGPWVYPSSNGEIGFALQDRKLLVATGPAGTLRTLSERRRSAPPAPTPTAARALSGRLGGGWVDVEKLLPGLGVSDEALAEASDAERVLRRSEEFLAIISRFRAFSLTGERFGSVVRVEVIGELAPEPAHSEWQD